jgi:ketosteroid isomerase-like protein
MNEGRGRSLTLVTLAIAAGMIGGIVGIIAINLYQRRAATQPPAPPTVATRASDQSTSNPISNAPTVPSRSVADSNDNGARPTNATTNAGGDGQATPATSDARADGAGTPRVAGGDQTQELRAALGEWIAATNARDIDRQMNFYEPRVAAFYLTRNVSREAVRAEKTNLFARASTVDVRADEPQITLNPDGRTATMRFRKQYSIEGGGQDRRGAVIQELRWRRTPFGWKITSERDLRVVN